jgi:glycerol-3-phosphate acyltransferase PlsX
MSASGSAVCVAVDAMGGDYGPRVAIEGAIAAAREAGLGVRLVGPQQLVREELARHGVRDENLQVVDAPDVIGMGEPVNRSTMKRRSSIQVAMELVRCGEAQAFFSAGNTAACWTIAKLVLGTIEDVDRPALAAVVPTPSGRTLLIDVGANATCKRGSLSSCGHGHGLRLPGV